MNQICWLPRDPFSSEFYRRWIYFLRRKCLSKMIPGEPSIDVFSVLQAVYFNSTDVITDNVLGLQAKYNIAIPASARQSTNVRGPVRVGRSSWFFIDSLAAAVRGSSRGSSRRRQEQQGGRGSNSSCRVLYPKPPCTAQNSFVRQIPANLSKNRNTNWVWFLFSGRWPAGPSAHTRTSTVTNYGGSQKCSKRSNRTPTQTSVYEVNWET